MALIKYEGFDHESDASDLYSGILATLIVVGTTQSASLGLSTTTQFSVGQALGVTATASDNATANAFTILPISPASNSVFVGAAMALSSSPSNATVLGFTNGISGQLYCTVCAGVLRVFRGDPTGVSVQLGNNVNNVAASRGWAYIEINAVVASGALGTIQVQVNGISVFNQTGINSSADGTTGVTGVMLGTVNTAATVTGFTAYFDDVYALDNTGPAPYNTFLGPVRVVTQYPIANATTVNFTGSAHHPNWQNVNQIMDGDATYNFSNVAGSIDTFTSDVLPASAAGVFAVKVVGSGRIDDAGVRTIQTYLKSGTGVATGTNVNLVGSYQYFSDIYIHDPNTAGAWTASAANLAQFGYKIVPSPGSPTSLGVATIVPSAVGVIGQTGPLSAVITFTLRVSGAMVVLPIIPATTLTVTITAVGALQQFDRASGTATLPGIQLGASSLVAGLLLSSISSLTVTTGGTLSQLTTVSALKTISLTALGNIVSGVGVSALISTRFQTLAAISLKVSASGVAATQFSAAAVAVQGVPISGVGTFGPFSASGAISGAITTNIHIGLSNWTASHAYTSGARVANTGKAYQCIVSGTSASSGGPTTTSSAIADGGAQWKFLSLIDFTSLGTWALGIPATLTQPVVGLLWNDGTITTTAGAPFLTLGDPNALRVTSSVNTITLTAAPGEGIRDALVGNTVPLTFDATKGVSFTLPAGAGGINYFDINESNVVIRGLQFRDPNSTSNSTIIQQENSSTSVTVIDCIIDGYGQNGGSVMVQCGTGAFVLANCLLVDRQTGSPDFSPCISLQSTANHIVNCTIVAVAAPNAAATAITANSAASPISNCIIMGYQTSINGGGGPIAPVDHCVFDTGTVGNAGFDNGHNLFGKTPANQFVSATADFRLKTGADALNVGASATSDIPSADDIAGTRRPQGAAWDIGAWEKV